MKLVRDAVVPQVSKINTSVPPELERIMGRALARDRDARYQNARDLGRDLTRFLFHYARPVHDDDIADLVRGAVTALHGQPVDGVQKIADLIDLIVGVTQANDTGRPPRSFSQASNSAGSFCEK